MIAGKIFWTAVLFMMTAYIVFKRIDSVNVYRKSDGKETMLGILAVVIGASAAAALMTVVYIIWSA